MVRVQAGGIARLIKDKEPKLVIKVVPGGGLVNPVRVSMHKDDLGWGITFVDKMAIEGQKPIYKKAYLDVRSLGGISGISHIHFVAARDTGNFLFFYLLSPEQEKRPPPPGECSCPWSWERGPLS